MTGPLDPGVASALASLPLARLAHFTPARNVPHILSDREIRSVAHMDQDARACYTPTDRLRLDGHPDKVSCSLQYPNGFYFAVARQGEGAVNYPDWVCLLIDKTAAAAPGTLFCPRNAAAADAQANPGAGALLACYAPAVRGQGGRTWRRGPAHDPGSPTDVQAEVLVTAPIPLSLVRAIVFPSDAAAREEHGRLDRFGLLADAPRFVVAPGLFDKWKVAAAVTDSVYPREIPWAPMSGTA